MTHSAELILVRHAPADHGGCLVGRTDVPVADLSAAAGVGAMIHGLLAGRCVQAVRWVHSPALRCRQTAQALAPDAPWQSDARLWEQDFGAEDGMRFDQLPDLGLMSTQALAARVPPARAGGGSGGCSGGRQAESFDAMAGRVAGALHDYSRTSSQPPSQISGQTLGPTVIVAHAGTVRAGIGHALGQPALGLRFDVRPLSLTRVLAHPAGWAVMSVNVGPFERSPG
ncbi:MAG: histidine phosphatase family protein [Paracoccaceae bacterium]